MSHHDVVKRHIRYKLIYYFISVFVMTSSIPAVFAMDQNYKQWLGMNAQTSFGHDKKWLAFSYAQLRLIDEAHPWQAILVEGGLGYRVAKDTSVWAGYRWTGRNPYNHFVKEDMLFQQGIFMRKINPYRFILRTRLEELTFSNTSQMAARLRERVAVEINEVVFKKAKPLLYDEIFFQLNHPYYASRSVIGENRLFLGFNIYSTAKIWWEVGYINQYQVKTPQQNQSQMSHIFSVTYNFS